MYYMSYNSISGWLRFLNTFIEPKASNIIYDYGYSLHYKSYQSTFINPINLFKQIEILFYDLFIQTVALILWD